MDVSRRADKTEKLASVILKCLQEMRDGKKGERSRKIGRETFRQRDKGRERKGEKTSEIKRERERERDRERERKKDKDKGREIQGKRETWMDRRLTDGEEQEMCRADVGMSEAW